MPVAIQSKARVYSRPLAGIAGSNLAGGVDACPLVSPEESYRLRRVIVCDLETLRMRRTWPTLGCYITEKYS